MKRYFKVTIEIPARDYAAFEDLAEELGIRISDFQVAECQPDIPQAPPSKRSRTNLTVDAVQAILAQINRYPNFKDREIVASLNLPYSPNTVNYVRNHVSIENGQIVRN